MKNGSLDLAAREIVLNAFLFHLAILDAAKELLLCRTDASDQRSDRRLRRTLRAEAAVYARRPQRTLRSHDRQRASRKLNVHAVAL
jgi:hypothetical protein